MVKSCRKAMCNHIPKLTSSFAAHSHGACRSLQLKQKPLQSLTCLCRPVHMRAINLFELEA